MSGDIRKHLKLTPFVPFAIRTADGHSILFRRAVTFISLRTEGVL